MRSTLRRNRRKVLAAPGEESSVIHLDYGAEFRSWSFVERNLDAALMRSFGRDGEAFENAMMDSFSSSSQNELPNRKK